MVSEQSTFGLYVRKPMDSTTGFDCNVHVSHYALSDDGGRQNEALARKHGNQEVWASFALAVYISQVQIRLLAHRGHACGVDHQFVQCAWLLGAIATG